MIPTTRITILIDILVQVLDTTALHSFLTEQHRKLGSTLLLKGALPAVLPVEVAVAEALIYSSGNPPPETYGISLRPDDCYARCEEAGKVRVQQIVHVFDEIALWTHSIAQYRACWFNEMSEEKDQKGLSLPIAVLEAVVLSNAGPNPADYGIEIDTYAARVLRYSPSQPHTYQELAGELHKHIHHQQDMI